MLLAAAPAVARQQWTIYDGLNSYADFDGQGNVTYRYLYGPAVDMIMARLGAEGDIVWYLGDHLGTVRDLADTSGQVIDHIAYDSFGGILAETNPAVGDRFKFTAREFDAAIEQYYYRARYYDGRTGRFTSEDPLGLAAGDANVYRYVANAPTAYADPLGWRLQFYTYTAVFEQRIVTKVTLKRGTLTLAQLAQAVTIIREGMSTRPFRSATPPPPPGLFLAWSWSDTKSEPMKATLEGWFAVVDGEGNVLTVLPGSQAYRYAGELLGPLDFEVEAVFLYSWTHQEWVGYRQQEYHSSGR